MMCGLTKYADFCTPLKEGMRVLVTWDHIKEQNIFECCWKWQISTWSRVTISKQNSGLNHQLIHCKKIINIFCDLWSYREIIVTVASFSVTLEHGPRLTFYEAEPSASNK